MSSFKDIEEVYRVVKTKEQLQTKVMYRVVERKTKSVVNTINRLAKRQLSLAFMQILRVNELKKHETRLMAEHEKFKKEFVVALNKKDAELQSIQRKTEEGSAVLFNLRNREVDMQGKVRAKDAEIAQLQKSIADIAALPVSQNPARKDPQQIAYVKLLESKIAAAEAENAEFKDKNYSFSTNVSLFVRDINEAMDSFEGSTMLVGSEDNGSFDNSRATAVAAVAAAAAAASSS